MGLAGVMLGVRLDTCIEDAGIRFDKLACSVLDKND